MRRVIQLAGARAEFALADDGTTWLWTGTGWQDASRGPLPQPECETGIYIQPNKFFLKPVASTVKQELRDEIDRKKQELIDELKLKPLKKKAKS